MSYWEFNGQNGLKGVEPTIEVLDSCPNWLRELYQPDPVNPAILPSEIILACLRTSKQARASFQQIFPHLDADSQARLTTLLEENPLPSQLDVDPQAYEDRFQHALVSRIPVRTVGLRGYRGRG